MSLASEMGKLTTEAAAASSARLEAVAAIGPALQRQLAADRASLSAAMADLTSSIRHDLDGVISGTAIIRGRAIDMIENLAAERADNTEALRDELEGYVTELQNSLSKLLGEYTRARAAMAAQESAARKAYLDDLRAQKQKLLADAAKFMDGLEKDRARAGRNWQQHPRAARKQKSASAKKPAESGLKAAPVKAAAKPVAAPQPPKPTLAKAESELGATANKTKRSPTDSEVPERFEGTRKPDQAKDQ